MLEQPDRAYSDALVDQIAICAAHIDSAQHQLLSHIRSFENLKGWSKQGSKSCAHWLSWRIGLGLCAAREKVRVAHALAALPSIDASLERGELSYAKVRAMTRVADATRTERYYSFEKAFGTDKPLQDCLEEKGKWEALAQDSEQYAEAKRAAARRRAEKLSKKYGNQARYAHAAARPSAPSTLRGS